MGVFRSHGSTMEYDPDVRPWAFYTAIVGENDITAVEIPDSLDVREVQWVSLDALLDGHGPGTILQLHGWETSETPIRAKLKYKARNRERSIVVSREAVSENVAMYSNRADRIFQRILSEAEAAERTRTNLKFVPETKRTIQGRWVGRSNPGARVETIRFDSYPRMVGAVIADEG